MVLPTYATTQEEKAELFEASSTFTPEDRAIAQAKAKKLWDEHMAIVGIECPIITGSPKQIDWAQNLWAHFIGGAHPKFKENDIRLFCQSYSAKLAKFWIDNRSEVINRFSGETNHRLENAIAAKIADMKHEASVTAVMSSRSDSEFKAKARRF